MPSSQRQTVNPLRQHRTPPKTFVWRLSLLRWCWTVVPKYLLELHSSLIVCRYRPDRNNLFRRSRENVAVAVVEKATHATPDFFVLQRADQEDERGIDGAEHCRRHFRRDAHQLVAEQLNFQNNTIYNTIKIELINTMRIQGIIG